MKVAKTARDESIFGRPSTARSERPLSSLRITNDSFGDSDDDVNEEETEDEQLLEVWARLGPLKKPGKMNLIHFMEFCDICLIPDRVLHFLFRTNFLYRFRLQVVTVERLEEIFVDAHNDKNRDATEHRNKMCNTQGRGRWHSFLSLQV